jgi:hypothetical protein
MDTTKPPETQPVGTPGRRVALGIGALLFYVLSPFAFALVVEWGDKLDLMTKDRGMAVYRVIYAPIIWLSHVFPAIRNAAQWFVDLLRPLFP